MTADVVVACWCIFWIVAITACGFARAGDRRRETERRIADACRREVMLHHPTNPD